MSWKQKQMKNKKMPVNSAGSSVQLSIEGKTAFSTWAMRFPSQRARANFHGQISTSAKGLSRTVCAVGPFIIFSFSALLLQGRVLAAGQVDWKQKASESSLFPSRSVLLCIFFVPSFILLPFTPQGRSNKLQEQMFLISLDTSYWYTELYFLVKQWQDSLYLIEVA